MGFWLKILLRGRPRTWVQSFCTPAMSKTGTVKNFFEEKGFGFITPDDGSDDCFAHVKENPELEQCQKGGSVTFDAVWDDRKGKWKAENVTGGSGGGGGGG